MEQRMEFKIKNTRAAGGFNWKNKKPVGLIKDLDPEN